MNECQLREIVAKIGGVGVATDPLDDMSIFAEAIASVTGQPAAEVSLGQMREVVEYGCRFWSAVLASEFN
jgi:hypothetical protein